MRATIGPPAKFSFGVSLVGQKWSRTVSWLEDSLLEYKSGPISAQISKTHPDIFSLRANSGPRLYTGWEIPTKKKM